MHAVTPISPLCGGAQRECRFEPAMQRAVQRVMAEKYPAYANQEDHLYNPLKDFFVSFTNHQETTTCVPGVMCFPGCGVLVGSLPGVVSMSAGLLPLCHLFLRSLGACYSKRQLNIVVVVVFYLASKLH